MFSRCPHCDEQQAVTTQQLRDRRGLLNCVACGQPFDALPSLSEQADDVLILQESKAFSFPLSDKVEFVWLGRAGSLAMLLVLLAQIAHFEGDRLIRQPLIRAALTQVCQALGCRVLAYKNPDEWVLSHSDLQTHLDRRYLLTAALTNQADFAQAFPELKLTLTDFKGQSLAQRVFTPRQYAADAVLGPNQTVQIRLPFIMAANVGGFTLTLI